MSDEPLDQFLSRIRKERADALDLKGGIRRPEYVGVIGSDWSTIAHHGTVEKENTRWVGNRRPASMGAR